MAFPRTIRNYNAFLGGTSFMGLITEGQLPQLQLQTEDYRGAGMDASVAIDMGMQAMTASATFAEWNNTLMTLIGTHESLVLRPAAAAQVDNQDVDAMVFTITGLWTQLNPDVLRGGQAANIQLTCGVHYYHGEQNGTELWDIDIENGIRKIGGTDQLAAIRAAMGL
ncbi:MAG: phage major tail tube protein [Pseudomonadota bacterium]